MDEDGAEATTGPGGLLGAARVSAYCVRRAWRWEPVWLVRLVGELLVLALLPAAQVVAVAALVRATGQGPAASVLPLIALTLCVGVNEILDDEARMTEQRTRNRLRRRYQDELLHAVARLSPQQLAEPGTIATIQACRGALFDLGRLVYAVTASLAALVTAISLCISVAVISPVAGALVVAALVPNLAVFSWRARLQDEAFVPYGEHERRTGYRVEQLVAQRSATELVTLGTGHRVADAADVSQSAADRLMDRVLRRLSRSGAVAGSATAVLLGGALVGVVVGGAGGAGVSAGLIGVLAGVAATRGAGFAYGDLVTTAPKVTAFRRFLGLAPAVSGQQVVRSATRLEAEGLTVQYAGAVVPALDAVTLRVDHGQIVALVGVNGAGKTTLVNALLGVVDLVDGTVTIDGFDAAALTLHRRLGHFGLLTQEFGRYELSVGDAVRLGSPADVTDDQVWTALDSAHAGDLVRSLPAGLDTQLGPQFGGVGLSGGEWQRLALARIYLRGAAIWVLDEPTSAIDAEAEQQIFAELQRTKADRLTLVVSHRAWTLRGMDWIYVLDHGRVVEQGRYEQLLSAQGRFAEIFAEQT